MEPVIGLGLLPGALLAIVYLLAGQRIRCRCGQVPYGRAAQDLAFIALIVTLAHLIVVAPLGPATGWILLLAMGLGALLGLVLECAVRRFARVIEGRSGRGRA